MAITITDNRYKVTGKLTNINGEPLANLEIKALDKDFSKNDYLGSTISQEDGFFQITFAQKAFKDLFDRKPDLFFEVYKDNTKIHSTSAMTIGNAEANDLPFHLVIDLPSPEIKEEIEEVVKEVESDDFSVVDNGDDFPVVDNGDDFSVVDSGENVVLGGGNTTQESNYLQSNLSDDNHTYNMVVATTGQAINATMKRFLRKAEFTEKVIWYKEVFDEEDNSTFVEMDPISNIDPFSIINKEDVPEEIESLKTAFFAVKASFGLPPEVAGTDIDDIIVLDRGNKEVTYNMFFKTLQIVTLRFVSPDRFVWKNISQPSGEKWVFKYTVPLKSLKVSKEETFEDTDEVTRAELLRLKEENSFSVNQLFIDLNRATPSVMPTIEGIPEVGPEKAALEVQFLNKYWEHIKTSKDPIFGYSVTQSGDKGVSFVQPTALDYQVMPHLDENGSPSENFDLYTLNYRMMTGSNPLPIGAGLFNWNWVRSDEAGELHGAMAIQREVFAAFLNDTLSKNLGHICLKPTVTFSGTVVETTETAKVTPDTSPGKFTYNKSGGKVILNLNYNVTDKKSDETILKDGHFGLTSKVTGDVSIEGSALTINLKGQLDMDYVSTVIGKSEFKGTLVSHTSTTKYNLAVTANGRITATLAPGFPKSATEGKDPIEMALISAFSVGSTLPVDVLNSYNKVGAALTAYANEIDDFINESGNKWVFPGGRTFIFKDAAFSESQDLVTHISYALQ